MAPGLIGQKRNAGAAIILLAALVLALSLSLPLLHHLHHAGQLKIEECPVSALSTALSLAVLAVLGLLLLLAPPPREDPSTPSRGRRALRHPSAHAGPPRTSPFLSIRT